MNQCPVCGSPEIKGSGCPYKKNPGHKLAAESAKIKAQIAEMEANGIGKGAS